MCYNHDLDTGDKAFLILGCVLIAIAVVGLVWLI